MPPLYAATLAAARYCPSDIVPGSTAFWISPKVFIAAAWAAMDRVTTSAVEPRTLSLSEKSLMYASALATSSMYESSSR